jgi:hypothetical protein
MRRGRTAARLAVLCVLVLSASCDPGLGMAAQTAPDLSSGAGPDVSMPEAVSTGPRAGLIWTGDAETGDLSQFRDAPWNNVGGTPPQVVTSPVRDGKYAIELGIPGATTPADGICCGSRDELLPKVPDLEEGDDLYFGFSTYLAPGFPVADVWQLITQFKQNFDGPPPLGLYVEQGQYRIEGGDGLPSGPKPFIIPLSAATTGRWEDWVLHVKFSTKPAIGYVEVWQNGVLVLPRYAPASGTLYPGTGSEAGSYVKTGPYRDPTITTPETMYLDNWRIGTTHASVAR